MATDIPNILPVTLLRWDLQWWDFSVVLPSSFFESVRTNLPWKVRPLPQPGQNRQCRQLCAKVCLLYAVTNQWSGPVTTGSWVCKKKTNIPCICVYTEKHTVIWLKNIHVHFYLLFVLLFDILCLALQFGFAINCLALQLNNLFSFCWVYYSCQRLL